MAASDLTLLRSPEFPQLLKNVIDRAVSRIEARPPRLVSLIARAIVHLNFQEPDQARDVLLDALTDFNFANSKKENTDGNRTAA